MEDCRGCLKRLAAACSMSGRRSSATKASSSVLLASSMLLLLGSSDAAQPPFKGFSGLRARNDSIRQVYYFEQAAAVVELGRKGELYNCEIIEIYEAWEKENLLENLTSIGKIEEIGFESMLDLMNKCDEVQPLVPPPGLSATLGFSKTVTSGIIPGTKWCGKGDVATTYYDLGTMKRDDRCCRKHDLCPIKVRASSVRYGINNTGISISHCSCDDEFLKCLKTTNTSIGNAMGYLYFNILPLECLNGSINGGFERRLSNGGKLFRETLPQLVEKVKNALGYQLNELGKNADQHNDTVIITIV